MVIGSWDRFEEDLKRAGKEAAMFPGFKIFMYDDISKTIYDGQNFSLQT